MIYIHYKKVAVKKAVVKKEQKYKKNKKKIKKNKTFCNWTYYFQSENNKYIKINFYEQIKHHKLEDIICFYIDISLNNIRIDANEGYISISLLVSSFNFNVKLKK